MNLAEIEPALLTVASALTGVELPCCVWQNAPRPMHNGSLVLLSWVSETPFGVDAPRWDFAAGADPLQEMTPTVVGHRRAVLQIDVEVDDQTSGVNAHAVMSRARARLMWPSVLASLRAVGLAVAGAEAIAVTDYVMDGRYVSRRTMDVRLNATAEETDLDGRTSYIATVGAVSTIQNPDGTTAPASIQPGGMLP